MGDAQATIDIDQAGRDMYQLVAELYPICRSITGNGLRETLRLVKRHIPLELHEVPSGTLVFDWTVPKEWNISDAYVKNSRGDRVIDFQRSNLHVVNYSVSVRARMSLQELRPHLFTLPEHPGWIPYRTSYYKETWGFCLTHKQLCALADDEYEVCIESSLEEGYLTYGECYLRGETPEEVLISCHACHPSLCNDNLSGVALSTFLAKHLCGQPRRYSYRFIFIPGTIGSITWLCLNESRVGQIRHGLVLACVGDGGRFTYKRSRRGDAEIDRAVAHVLRHSGDEFEIIDFIPYGHDERQFCSPGFDLPVGCFMRTPDSRSVQYHTSADNLDFVHPRNLGESLSKCLELIGLLEANKRYVNQIAKCEPQLSRRGLYRAIGGERDSGMKEITMLWVLNLSDGGHTLLDIAERAGLGFAAVRQAADVLVEHGLLRETTP
jgi:aminopeptidase-like protein